MRLLQDEFGNAGRGWIAPFKLSRTNEPDDYFITSSVRDWIAGRCIQRKRKTSVGMYSTKTEDICRNGRNRSQKHVIFY